MFAKTRIRLTLLNAAVFFVILACIGLIVYLELRHQLYGKVDASIVARAKEFQSENGRSVFMYAQKLIAPLPSDLPQKSAVQVQVIDPRIGL